MLPSLEFLPPDYGSLDWEVTPPVPGLRDKSHHLSPLGVSIYLSYNSILNFLGFMGFEICFCYL